MFILAVGLLAVALVVFASRLADRNQSRVLEQFETLEKRLGLTRRVYKSRWGKGIGERCVLSGSNNGFSCSLYSHTKRTGEQRLQWTTLAIEVLFAGDGAFLLSLCDRAKLEAAGVPQTGPVNSVAEKIAYTHSGNDFGVSRMLKEQSCVQHLHRLASADAVCFVRLGKGFLEFSHLGQMDSDAVRVRFQDAFTLLGKLADEMAEAAKRQGCYIESVPWPDDPLGRL